MHQYTKLSTLFTHLATAPLRFIASIEEMPSQIIKLFGTLGARVDQKYSNYPQQNMNEAFKKVIGAFQIDIFVS